MGYLRSQRQARIVLSAIETVNRRDDFQVVDYVILGNHLHMIVEAENERALAGGMRALGIRVAMRLNSLQNRRGPAFVDRYHAHVLKTRREVVHAVKYVRANYQRHTHEWLPPRWRDPLAGRVAEPRTWLLRAGTPAG